MTQRRRYNYRQIEPDDFCKVFDKYVKQKGLDEEVCIHLILSTLKFGPAEKAELFAVLKVALPDVLSEKKSKKLSNLLQKMKKEGVIDARGVAVNSEWYIKGKD